MKIERLFHVLVVGGSLLAGCSTASPQPDPMPVERGSEAGKAEEAPEEAAPKAGDAREEEDDGVCAWL